MKNFLTIPLLFFFSSRRRHTRCSRDWSSDVCSSDLERQGLRPGDALAVLQATGTAKSKQSGFEITLPPRQVAIVRVVSLFGDSETNEGSVCEVTSGTVDPGALATLFVAEPGRGGTP